jgi:NTP pyrophosphatase (non-canonical NTP hydrolase)
MQQQVDEWIKSIGIRYFTEMTQLAQLTEEVGEVASIISRTYGEQSYKQGVEQGDLADELADVLFIITCLANQTGINLQDAFDRNMDKKTKRDAIRHAANEKLR